MGILKCPY